MPEQRLQNWCHKYWLEIWHDSSWESSQHIFWTFTDWLGSLFKTLLTTYHVNPVCLFVCVQNISLTTRQILTKQSEDNKYMYLYNRLYFGANIVKYCRHSQVTLINTNMNPKLKLHLEWLQLNMANTTSWHHQKKKWPWLSSLIEIKFDSVREIFNTHAHWGWHPEVFPQHFQGLTKMVTILSLLSTKLWHERQRVLIITSKYARTLCSFLKHIFPAYCN